MIDGVGLDQWGPTSLLAAFVLLVFLGGLIPRWIHNQRIKDKDEQIVSLKAALDKRDEQFETLFKSNELIIRLLEDIKQQAARTREVGRPS